MQFSYSLSSRSFSQNLSGGQRDGEIPETTYKPLLSLSINIGQDAPAKIVVYDFTNPKKRASLFVKDHDLPEEMIKDITTLIQQAKSSHHRNKKTRPENQGQIHQQENIPPFKSEEQLYQSGYSYHRAEKMPPFLTQSTQHLNTAKKRLNYSTHKLTPSEVRPGSTLFQPRAQTPHRKTSKLSESLNGSFRQQNPSRQVISGKTQRPPSTLRSSLRAPEAKILVPRGQPQQTVSKPKTQSSQKTTLKKLMKCFPGVKASKKSSSRPSANKSIDKIDKSSICEERGTQKSIGNSQIKAEQISGSASHLNSSNPSQKTEEKEKSNLLGSSPTPLQTESLELRGSCSSEVLKDIKDHPKGFDSMSQTELGTGQVERFSATSISNDGSPILPEKNESTDKFQHSEDIQTLKPSQVIKDISDIDKCSNYFDSWRDTSIFGTFRQSDSLPLPEEKSVLQSTIQSKRTQTTVGTPQEQAYPRDSNQQATINF